MSEQGVKKLLLVAGVVLTVMISLSPVCYMLFTALSGNPDFLLPTRPFTLTLDHLFSVITSDSLHFLAYTRNSLLVSAATAFISVFLASLAAYALTRLPLPGKGVFLGGVLTLSKPCQHPVLLSAQLPSIFIASFRSLGLPKMERST